MAQFVPKQLTALMMRFRYPILVLLVGIGLMLLPAGKAEESESPTVPETDLQSQLETILSQIDGAGRVRVLLTVDTGRETVYQMDVEQDRSDTVIVEGDDRTESGLVRRTAEPIYRGAVVACQGADRPAVRLAIVEAVRCATGLGADRISVQKLQ